MPAVEDVLGDMLYVVIINVYAVRIGLGLEQGFHSSTSYGSNQDVRTSIRLMFSFDFCVKRLFDHCFLTLCWRVLSRDLLLGQGLAFAVSSPRASTCN